MENSHFESKTKNAEKYAKNVSTTHCSSSMQKNASKKQLILEKCNFENCQKWPPSKGYNTWQNRHFGSKIKNA